MNVYDFDKTIYDGDSSFDFYKYCLLKYPSVWRHLPIVLWFGAGFALGIVKKHDFKNRFFKFSLLLPDIDKAVSAFWDKNISKIKKFYLKTQRPDDLIISASPRFILAEICKRLGITELLCTETDPKTASIIGENCYGEEKVKRFDKAGYKRDEVESFYSDSTSDSPLAALAKEAFIVTGEELTAWKE